VTFDQLSNKVIGCAIEVHRELGPGLLESANNVWLPNSVVPEFRSDYS